LIWVVVENLTIIMYEVVPEKLTIEDMLYTLNRKIHNLYCSIWLICEKV